MIIIKLWGGLCNQMFQYAFGYMLSRQNDEEVFFDTEFFKNQPSYCDHRNIEIKSYPNVELKVVSRPKAVRVFQPRYVSFFTRRINRCHIPCLGGVEYIKEREHVYWTDIPYFPQKINYYDGYWQSERYFEKYADELRSKFIPPAGVKKEVDDWFAQFQGKHTVAIHVRRKDMIGRRSGYTEEDMVKYYFCAMEYMSHKVSNIEFVLFSDDITWCKKNIPTTYGSVTFQCNNWGAIGDLYGISLCENGIIFQSTFGWWGNWLDANKNRIVIAPKGEYLNNMFIPNRWTRV